MSDLETAMGTLVIVFNKYAASEGKKDSLSKAELKTLLEKEMPRFIANAKNKDIVDKLMKDLDMNGDSEVDFKEYIIFVAALSCAFHNICMQKGAGK
ncbi:protein S100-P-like [Latimeria chalumnae]|uniref:protein S100-P-like n=1 Tax=Latimeria chalumnae TaxID=7897 RepID=UPI0003C1595C|nr:PREDICTED: protein S100-P-like [Latimeria chalumnae]|eukprot:XP_006014057.1 PREDICTED: protein S100-P-like [Latimeria chalumnae]